MKSELRFISVTILLSVITGSTSFASENTIAEGHAFVQSAEHAGCDKLDVQAEKEGVSVAEAAADANAEDQCDSKNAVRLGDYLMSRATKYRGAGCLITAAAYYLCRGEQ